MTEEPQQSLLQRLDKPSLAMLSLGMVAFVVMTGEAAKLILKRMEKIGRL